MYVLEATGLLSSSYSLSLFIEWIMSVNIFVPCDGRVTTLTNTVHAETQRQTCTVLVNMAVNRVCFMANYFLPLSAPLGTPVLHNQDH